MYVILTLLVWFAFWLLWSGLYKPLLIILGIISCLLVFVLARRMAYFDKSIYVLSSQNDNKGSWDNDDWRIGLDYDFSQNSFMYGTVATGSKAGSTPTPTRRSIPPSSLPRRERS